MNAPTPSIAIFIDPTTKDVTVQFMPQPLSPAQYGVVIASLVSHLARMFKESNPEHSEDDILEAIRAGIDAGLSQRDDMVISPHTH